MWTHRTYETSYPSSNTGLLSAMASSWRPRPSQALEPPSSSKILNMTLENQKKSLQISLLKLKPLVFLVMSQSSCNSCLSSPKARLFQLKPHGFHQPSWCHWCHSCSLCPIISPNFFILQSPSCHVSHTSSLPRTITAAIQKPMLCRTKIHVNFRGKSCWFKCSLKPLIRLLRF